MYPKPWLCPSGHVLGSVERIQETRRRYLKLYRQADNPASVIAEITGPVANITCSICGCTRDWHIGEESIQDLLEARGISHNNPQSKSPL